APLLTGAPTDTDWAQHLAEDLRTPRFTISEWEAVGRRLRRNYLWIFALLAASWNLKVYLHPKPAVNFDEFLSRAAIGFVPGELKRPDLDDIHRTQFPVKEETITK